MSDYCFKVVLLGSSGVGKSLLKKCFNNNSKNYVVNGEKVRLNVVDGAGEVWSKMVMRSMGRYLNGVDGVIYVFDLTRHETLVDVNKWVELNKKYNKKDNCKTVLVGNKLDACKGVRFNKYSITKLLDGKGFNAYYQVSARTGYNVSEVFCDLTKLLIIECAESFS